MAKEGLEDLAGAGRVVAGTIVDLARTPVGLAVRTGAARPDISSVDAFRRALLQAKTVAFVDSTVGIYLRTKLFPQLGVAEQVAPETVDGRCERRRRGRRGFHDSTAQRDHQREERRGRRHAYQPKFRYISIFSAAIVTGAAQADAGQKLIDYLASDKARAAIANSGMESIGRR